MPRTKVFKAFELWVLLHFVDTTILESKPSHRSEYHEELSNIFRKVVSPNEFLSRALEYPNFNYKNSLKSAKAFRFTVRPKMIERTERAIARATRLYAKYSVQLSAHQKCPCTLVIKLVEELLELGGKVLPE